MQFPIELFYALFAAVAAYIVFRIVKYRGLRGAYYGSAIAQTTGEIDIGHFGGANQTIRVHRLENGAVALEQTSKSLGSVNIQGVPMKIDQVDSLIKFLNQAKS